MNFDLTEPGLLSAYEALAEFDGEPEVFWGKLCEYSRARLEAEAVSLLVGGSGNEIRVLAQIPDGAARKLAKAGVTTRLAEASGSLFENLSGSSKTRFEGLVLPAREGLPSLWVVVEGASEDEALKELVAKEIRLLADMYQARRHARRADEKLLTLTEVLDLGLALGETTKFEEAAMRICNELAAPMKASRISLAWIEGSDLKLKATSHGGRISANSQEALALQEVMEEATDQDNEVSYPELAGASPISREHQQFSLAREGESVLSVPLRNPDAPVGAICLERPTEDGPWEQGEMERARLIGDLVAPSLAGLHLSSGWFGKRLWRSVRRRSARGLGPENTGWKLTGILLFIGIVALALIQVEHKVRAPFILKTDAAAIISAPFPGYIDEVHYHLGDVVQEGQSLVDLDRKELLLEESDTVAVRNKNLGESRRHEANGELAQMMVAKADVEQADARLAIIRHRLGLTQVTAPFLGVVVEGDLRERLLSPVQAGEELLKVVQLKDLFGQLQVDNRDVSYLEAGSEGEIAFASRPGEKFPVKIDRFEPVAQFRPEGTVFLLRAGVTVEPESWWRPGMSGVCKINAGKRSLLWIGGHRLIETLRLWIWV